MAKYPRPDPEIGTTVALLKKKKLSKRKGTVKDTDDFRTILRHRHNFVLRNKLLYKKVKTSANCSLPDFLFCRVRSVRWFGGIVVRGCALRSLLGSYVHQK